jgi:3-methyladenine DNA glycosylase AlkC
MVVPVRRGARHPSAVPAEILAALEAGHESANHMEQIAMDMGNLLVSQFPGVAHRAPELRGLGLVARMRAGGRVLQEELGFGISQAGIAWQSDTARGWAAMAVGHAPGLSLAERLELIRPYAADKHFAVREWAWLSLRPHIAADVRLGIELLTEWTTESSERLRRYATEVTRPRGVWSAHLPALKAEPALGLPLLTPLRADPARYVQDSVANWLNDAAKSAPLWVSELCQQWLQNGPTASTSRICRRATRNIRNDS